MADDNFDKDFDKIHDAIDDTINKLEDTECELPDVAFVMLVEAANLMEHCGWTKEEISGMVIDFLSSDESTAELPKEE
ncbi:MAG: hypothetical protein OSB15_07295 [Amylibacter sp.]|nr:hypothetical protein [Amylibacter sp.]|tara:strand:- start:569 stop:802 length:234 start_codon:yes stop_codon:yes gene_type:complete